MSSSNSDTDSDSDLDLGISVYKDETFSICNDLLKNSIDREEYCESSSDHMSNNLIKIVSTYIPILVAGELSKKRSHGGSTIGRRYIFRDREARNELIIKDYFMGSNSKYSSEKFRQRFRMDEALFGRIFEAIKQHDSYFTQKVDATGRLGVSPLQKMFASIRMLAYGVPADSIDEYVQIGESTTIESLKRFCNAVIDIFEERYLRKPNVDDVAKLLKQNKARGFPGMLGSLDCMHWHWGNCPKAWHGMYTNGYKKVPTLILEIIASSDLWIWHAFFGMAGTNNDINVLDRSPLFDDIINGVAPGSDFEVSGHQYKMGYYLSDGIYPPYATLIQSISEPSNAKEKLFAKHQESVRKDVERAFGVLQKRWHIVKGPARMWKATDLGKIMKTCIILHNMIIESEQHHGYNPEHWRPPSNETGQNVVVEHDHRFLAERLVKGMAQLRDIDTHRHLKTDLINYLWELYGDGELN